MFTAEHTGATLGSLTLQRKRSNLSKKSFSELSDNLKNAANFFGSILLHPKTLSSTHLEIVLDTKLEYQGLCQSEDDSKKPRFFTIKIRNAPLDDDPIQTLAHEMVHLKQYATGQLADNITNVEGKLVSRILWNGAPHKFNPREDLYLDSPWEIEAFGREFGLYKRWLKISNCQY